jgi:hypothetical protein
VKTPVLLLVAILISPLPVGATVARITLREQSRLTVEASGLRGVVVQNPRGWVEIHPSADGRIHVSALKLSSASEASRAQHFGRLTRVETETRGGRFLVRVLYPQNQTIRVDFWRFLEGEFDLPRVEVRLLLDVPPEMAVELGAASGDLKTFDLSGPQSLQTVSGEIEVRNASGPVSGVSTSGDVVGSDLARARLHSVSGDVSLDGVHGPLRVETTSGDINVRGAADSLDFSTSSGDVRVDAAPRGIRVGTTSGDIQIDGAAAGLVHLHTISGEVHAGLERGFRGADIRTVSGDIELRIPERLGCNVTLDTQSGSLESSGLLQVRTSSRHRMSGAIGGGGPPVILQSSSGDIALTGGGR